MSKPWWKSAMQFMIGISIVVAFGMVALALWPRPEPPSGWKVIRPPQDVMALVEYQDELWVGGRDGVEVIDLKLGEVLHEPGSFQEFDYVSSLLVSPGGDSLFIGHIDGLTRLKGNAWQTFTRSDGLPDNQILALATGKEGEIWVGTTAGIVRFEDEAFLAAPGGNPLQNIAISVLYLDSRERLWIGNGYTTQGGLAMYDGTRWHEFDVQDGLAHPMVNAIMEDQDGAIWIGTGFASLGGASIHDKGRFTTLTVEDGLAGPKVRSIYKDQADTMWIGSEYDGVAHQNGDDWMIYTPQDGLAGWEIKAMLHDSLGNFWLGTENGLTRIDCDVWRQMQ